MSDIPGFAPFSARLPLSRATLDRDHMTRARGIEALLDDFRTRAIVLHDGKALMDGPDRLAILPASAVPHAALAVYLGRTVADAPDLPRDTPFIAVAVDARSDIEAPDGGESQWGDLRRIGARLDERDAGLFTQALAILNWHTAYGFSPSAGAATVPTMAGWVRRDEDAGKDFFPRTDAAVIVGVVDHEDRILLGSNAMWEANRFSLLAGFVEPGESLEAAIIREVFEESGITVEDPQYLGSQPWPFPASLMVGFMARVPVGGTTVGTPDGEEILAVRWFTRDEMAEAVASKEVVLPGPTSIARAIIEHWFGAQIDDGSRR